MAVFDGIFQRYRNSNKNKSITQSSAIQQQPVQTKDKFGEDALQRNPNLNIFNNAQNNIADIIDRRSVVSQFETDTQLATPDKYFSSLFSGTLALPLYTNKAERIRQYRAMAMYSECDFCICEIADDVLHEDDTGQNIKLNIPVSKKHLDTEKRTILQLQFDKFIELFKFKDDAFWMVKKLLVEGEVAFENIINPKKPELGIIGVKYLPTEYYETLLNGETGRSMGIVFNKENLTKDLKTIISNSCIGGRSIFNSMIQTQSHVDFDKDNVIPILWPQLTYISSGEVSPNGLMVFPLIEKCKQAYHQLALMQDAAVILRVTRAPERLLFNINTGGLPDKIGRQKIIDFINNLKSRKIVSSKDISDQSDHEITQVYNPVSMLETYFFGKSEANDGTTIESVGSTADYEQIADIEFFLRRLFKQFKVPFSRYKAPENSLERDDTITYEEYSMARHVIRIQRRMSMGLKRSFITHLKLIGLWKKYNLKESDFSVDFVAPILYDLYQTQKRTTAMMDTYKAVVDQEELSKINAMKKILKMTDEEIDQNFLNLIKEKQLVALADYYADKIGDDNKPLDFKSPLRLSGEDKEGQEGEENADQTDEQSGGEEESPSDEAPKAPSTVKPENGAEAGNKEPSFGLGSES